MGTSQPRIDANERESGYPAPEEHGPRESVWSVSRVLTNTATVRRQGGGIGGLLPSRPVMRDGMGPPRGLCQLIKMSKNAAGTMPVHRTGVKIRPHNGSVDLVSCRVAPPARVRYSLGVDGKPSEPGGQIILPGQNCR
jgi:hypothetical protein